MANFVLNATNRDVTGKGSSRRLRRLENLVPAIVYGGQGEPAQISLKHNELIKLLEDEAFYASVVELNLEGATESVILKDLQRHPAKPVILHADFMRVDMKVEVVVNIPLHFINEDSCVGVKMQSGKIHHDATEVEVRCLPGNLPEFIEVDMLEVEAGTTLHLSDLVLPEGVVSTQLALGADHDQPLVSVNKPSGAASDEDSEGEGEA
ncbi:MAG: 50S ribosomal protein L25/general stress protein Ctc [Litorivicinus sp.]